MTHHPHVHMIVPGGGLLPTRGVEGDRPTGNQNGSTWVKCRKNFFLSVRVLSRLYRRLILEGLVKLHKGGKLQFYGQHTHLADRRAFDNFLKPLRKTEWVVYAKAPFAGPKAVLAYLSRYTHRVAISNSRLVYMGDQGITFRYKDYRINGPARHKTMTLAAHEFMRRFLIHVLPKGQHRIRHYGFLGNGNRAANIATIRQLLGAVTTDHDRNSNADDEPRVLALPCPCCGGQLIIVEAFAPQQQPRAPPTTTKDAA